MRQQLGVAPALAADATRLVDLAVRLLLQTGLGFVYTPSAYMQNNGVVVVGQRPASSATVTFGATSGSGVTATFSAATLLGSASDVGRIITILDTTYKFFTVTGNSGSSTTVCQGTLSGGTLSTVGAFANSAIWLSSSPTGGIAGYSSPIPRVVGSSYSLFPAGAISTGSAAGWYWTNWSSTTVGQVYNNPYASGFPAAVASPTAFVTTGPGAFTAANGVYTNGPLVSMPGNSVGINGSLETQFILSCTGASNKLVRAMIGASTYGGLNCANYTTYAASGGSVSLTNRGATNSQIYTVGSASYGGDFIAGGGGQSPATLSIDTTANQNVGGAVQMISASDCLIIDRISVKLFPTSP